MGNYVTWNIGTSLLLNIPYPLDHIIPSAPAAIGGAVDGVDTVKGYLFSHRVKSVLSADAPLANATITVESVAGLEVLQFITIEEGNGTWSKHRVSAIDATTLIITFDTVLAFGAKAGARYWRTFGTNPVVGVSYGGTPDPDTEDWGYVYEFPYTYDTALRRDEKLEAVAVLHLASTGAHYTRSWDVIMAEATGAP